MGRFFNLKIMNLKKIPTRKEAEVMRKEYNKSLPVEPKEDKYPNLTKARKARKLKAQQLKGE